MIVAIDGPAAAGKGTLARRLAAALGLAYLDTGLLYRAVAAVALERGCDTSDPAAASAVARGLEPKDLSRPDLRSEAVTAAASRVAAIAEVREALLAFQRGFAAAPPNGKPGAVLDGRDIGTVVCPAAAAKLFVTASLEARAERRHKELLERGETSIYARVLEEMRARDARDSERAAAPLKAADDAVLLDTTEMTLDAAFEAAMAVIEACGRARAQVAAEAETRDERKL